MIQKNFFHLRLFNEWVSFRDEEPLGFLLYDRDIPWRVISSDLMRIMIIVMTTPGRGPGMGSDFSIASVSTQQIPKAKENSAHWALCL